MPSDSSSRRLTCEALGRAERVNHRIGNAANAANIERNRPICIALNGPAKTLAQGNVSANEATDNKIKPVVERFARCLQLGLSASADHRSREYVVSNSLVRHHA